MRQVPSRAASLSVAAIFGLVLLGAWVVSWTRTARGRLWYGATIVDDTPEFRRDLAAVRAAVPDHGTLLGIARGTMWSATHWSRWLYPRRVVWMTPSRFQRSDRRWLRDALGIRYVLDLTGDRAPAGTSAVAPIAVEEGVAIRELSP